MKTFNATPKLESQTTKRPGMITALSWGVLLMSAAHFFKFIQVLLSIHTLRLLPMTISPAYLAGNGLFWGISGIFLSWGFWKGKSWSRSAGILFSIGYSLAFWIDLIWIAEPEGLAQRWPINLVLTIIGLGMILLVLSRKSTRDYFWENPAKIP